MELWFWDKATNTDSRGPGGYPERVELSAIRAFVDDQGGKTCQDGSAGGDGRDHTSGAWAQHGDPGQHGENEDEWSGCGPIMYLKATKIASTS